MQSFYLIKPYFVANRWQIVIGLACLTTVDILQLLIPRVVKWAVDDLTILGASARRLLVYAGIIVALAVLIGGFRYVWRRCLIGMSRQVEEGLRNRLFSHIQSLSAPYFDHVRSGDLMARATNDINHVRMAAGMGMVALTDAVVLGTASIAFMAYINLRLTVLVLIPMPFIALSTRFFGKKMHKRYQIVQAAFADLTEMVRERFAGIRVIKAYTRERESRRQMAAESRRYVNQNLKLVRITRSFFPMMVFFSNISLALVLLLGGRQTIKGIITPGDFVAFISYLGLLTWPMMALGWLTNLIQRGKASLERIDTVLRVSPEITDGSGPRQSEGDTTALEFKNVSFAYNGQVSAAQANLVLQDITFDLKRGQILGVVGPPGSGKTTLLQLIPRIYDVGGGTIRLNGADVRRYPLNELRGLVSFMPQEPFLFGGTVGENIRLSKRPGAPERLKAALRSARLEETVESFPHKLGTVVGEKGVILSGGQKQRVVLARSLLYPAPFLILDDPISQVDMETGNAIINTIRSLAGERTIVIVSHRISALSFADLILVLENGRISERGSHRSLMAVDGYYARTHRLQELEEERHAH